MDKKKLPAGENMSDDLYKELFILTIVNACGDVNIAGSEYDAHIESMGDDIDLSTPEDDAQECMSCWSE